MHDEKLRSDISLKEAIEDKITAHAAAQKQADESNKPEPPTAVPTNRPIKPPLLRQMRNIHWWLERAYWFVLPVAILTTLPVVLGGPPQVRELLEQGRVSEAITTLVAHFERHPGDPEDSRILANIYLVQQDYRDALRFALNAYPADPTAKHRLLGRIYEGLADYPKALEQYGALSHNKGPLSPDLGEALEGQVSCYEKMGQLEAARRLLPQFIEAMNYQQDKLQQLQLFRKFKAGTEGIQLCTAEIRAATEPIEKAEWLLSRAQFHRLAGDCKAAMADLDSAEQLNPTIEAERERAQILALSDVPAAKKSYDELIPLERSTMLEFGKGVEPTVEDEEKMRMQKLALAKDLRDRGSLLLKMHNPAKANADLMMAAQLEKQAAITHPTISDALTASIEDYMTDAVSFDENRSRSSDIASEPFK